MLEFFTLISTILLICFAYSIHGDFAEKHLPTSKNAGLPLPPKPTTLQEANAQKGYFPVSWRIIGGGVPLSQEPSEIISPP